MSILATVGVWAILRCATVAGQTSPSMGIPTGLPLNQQHMHQQQQQQPPAPSTEVDLTCQDFFDYAELERDWKMRYLYESYKMYPSGARYCDTNATYNEKSYGFGPHINFEIPFYGSHYRSIYVSPDGFLTLNDSTIAPLSPSIFLDRWPNPNYPLGAAPDPPFIAPFYSDANLNHGPFEPSQISYRILDKRLPGSINQQRVVQGYLDTISTDIRAAVVGADTFQANYGILVTWYRVTFDGNDCVADQYTDNCARNTYQVAVVTDQKETFSVFNYFNMTWVGGGSAQNCDRMLGIATGASPNCKPAHIGFNAGQARGFRPLPYSNQNSIAQLESLSGSNVTGRFFYQIDSDVPIPGGCTNDSSLAPLWPMGMYPSYGSMFGGHQINVSGPCFVTGDRNMCRFGTVVVNAVYVSNMMRVICIQPQLDVVGYIKLAISTDGGRHFHFETDYLVDLVTRATQDVDVVVPNNDWMNPDLMELTWSPQHLSSFPGERVDIRLFGYRENPSGDDPNEWQELYTFTEGYSNTGLYNFVPADHQCGFKDNLDQYKCTTFDVGAFAVSIHNADTYNPRRVWSDGVALGWFIKDSMTLAEGEDWVKDKCLRWYHEDDDDLSWNEGLLSCPCTFDEAYSDFGRFIPDPSCYRGSASPYNCMRHIGATHCFVTTYTNSKGSGNQCCYGIANELMYSGDGASGSRPQRSSIWGKPPYTHPPFIPALSHWVRDVVPYFYCCRYQSEDATDCYTKFLNLRTTKGCNRNSNTQSAGQAIAFGDPHFKTLDGTFYTFNGKGEFWLLMGKEANINGQPVTFRLQARMEQPPRQSWGEIRATYMTAVAIQQNSGPCVAIVSNHHGRDKQMSVFVNSQLLDFSTQGKFWQEFDEFIIINNDVASQKVDSNFTVVYRSGFGVQVTRKNGPIQVTLSAPPELKYKTGGLFGTWNDQPIDDLQPRPPGGPSFRPEETEKVHSLFGLKWMVTASESLFQNLYHSKMDYQHYNDVEYQPVYIPQTPNNGSASEGAIRALCNSDAACTFDYKVTQSSAIARDALEIQALDMQRRIMSMPSQSCGWLAVEYSIKEEPISSLPGSFITITGCIPGYTLGGPTQYLCRHATNVSNELVWQPAVTTACWPPGQTLSQGQIIAIAAPAALLLVLIIIGIIVLILCCRRRRRKRVEKEAYVAISLGDEAMKWGMVVPTEKPVPEEKKSKKKKNKEKNGKAIDSVDGSVSGVNTTESEGSDIKGTKKKPKSKKSWLKGSDADSMDTAIKVPPPIPEKPRQYGKPPRPSASRQNLQNTESSSCMDLQNYDNHYLDGSDSTPGSGNRVSWGADTIGQRQPLDDTLSSSVLKYSKSSDDIFNSSNMDSGVPVKPPRPYKYPVQSDHDSSNQSYSSQTPILPNSGKFIVPSPSNKRRGLPQVEMNPSGANNIPTAKHTASPYYNKRYGKH